MNITALDGTVALITGASSGIGDATARRLAEHGASVVVVARRKDRLDTLVSEIESAGGTALTVEADITDRDQAGRAVQSAVERYGRLDSDCCFGRKAAASQPYLFSAIIELPAPMNEFSFALAPCSNPWTLTDQPRAELAELLGGAVDPGRDLDGPGSGLDPSDDQVVAE